jgi:hypothetical protein
MFVQSVAIRGKSAWYCYGTIIHQLKGMIGSIPAVAGVFYHQPDLKDRIADYCRIKLGRGLLVSTDCIIPEVSFPPVDIPAADVGEPDKFVGTGYCSGSGTGNIKQLPDIQITRVVVFQEEPKGAGIITMEPVPHGLFCIIGQGVVIDADLGVIAGYETRCARTDGTLINGIVITDWDGQVRRLPIPALRKGRGRTLYTKPNHHRNDQSFE